RSSPRLRRSKRRSGAQSDLLSFSYFRGVLPNDERPRDVSWLFAFTAFTIFAPRVLAYVRRATRFTIANVLAIVGTAGCVDDFRGSNIELDLSPGTPVQAHVGGTAVPGELPLASHLTIFAIQQDASADRLFEVARFEIHRIVD